MDIASQRSATVKLKMGMVASVLMCLLISPVCAQAQQQATPSEEKSSHLRLDFLLTEYDGQKKVSSMPYTMYVEAASHPVRGGRLRMGVRVPMGAASKFLGSYTDVGTNIDCSATISGDNLYNLDSTVSRSSVYSTDEQGTETAYDASGLRTVVRTFNTDFSLEMHDGQTAEGPTATDPFNGHILKISVTLHVIK